MQNSNKLTQMELSILEKLQQDARLTSAELAGSLNTSLTPIWRRIKKLEQLGIIRSYRAELDARRLGFEIDSYITITVDSHDERTFQQFEAAVISCSSIVACHVMSGSGDYLIRVICKDVDSFANFVTQYLNKLPGVKNICSSIVLKTIKKFEGIPMPSLGISIN